MHWDSEIDFKDLRTIFLRDSAYDSGRIEWPLGALDIANRQFGRWKRAVLTHEEVLAVMLPWHSHGVDLVPPGGSSVAETLARLHRVDHASQCYKCIHRHLQQLSRAETPAVFLSVAPIDHPRYSDYRGLVDRGCRGLTHLDGLHRLIARALEKKGETLAYIADWA